MLNQLTFQNAQMMFSGYFTLKPNHILFHDLEKLLPDNKESIENIRDFYNKAILKYYPNETTIKAAFLNQILFRNEHDTTIFELSVGRSRVDLCQINNTSIAYEIKTDLDTLKRLDKQILDYQHVFEQVYIICSLDRLSEIENILPDTCGIFTYTFSPRKQHHFKKYRSAKINITLDSHQQLSCLWLSELRDYSSRFETLSKAEIIEHLLTSETHNEINNIFKSTLSKRFESQWSFLTSNRHQIYEIDYQWFFQNQMNPHLVYNT